MSNNTRQNTIRDAAWSEVRKTHAQGVSGVPAISFSKMLKEEEPTMKSVTIAPAPWQTLPKPMSLGLPRPCKPISRNPQKREELEIAVLPPPKATEIPSSNWKVPHSTLAHLPRHFILERTSRFISCNNATIVSTRISECLRSRSIQAFYDNEKATAKCINRDYVNFRIRLFLGRGECAHGIIVEVQRRSGCPTKFMKDCRAILSAAEGDDLDDEMPPYATFSVPEHIKAEAENNQLADDDISRCLTTASTLLQSGAKDSQLLAVQMLSTATDESHTNAKVIKAIIDAISDTTSQIFKCLTSILDTKIVDQIPGDEHDNEGDHDEKLYHLSLLLISNTVRLAKKGGLLKQIVEDCSWFIKTLVPILIENLKYSHLRPQASLFAVKALNSLIDVSNEAKRTAYQNDVVSIIIEANKFGRNHHVDLASETNRCIIFLNCN